MFLLEVMFLQYFFNHYLKFFSSLFICFFHVWKSKIYFIYRLISFTILYNDLYLFLLYLIKKNYLYINYIKHYIKYIK